MRKRHTIIIDESVLKDLKMYAVKTDQSYSKVIEEAVKKHIINKTTD